MHTAVLVGYRYNEFIVIFRELLKKGCDINAQTFNGHTALHMAVDKRSVLMTLELLKHGANFNLLDTNRISPLHLAIDRMDMKIVEMLLNYGINFDTLKNESGKTALELALEYGEHDIVKMISFHK